MEAENPIGLVLNQFPPLRALEIITGHVIYNPAYSYKFQLKTTEVSESELTEAFAQLVQTSKSLIDPVVKILVNMLESKAPEERDEQKVNLKRFRRLFTI